MDKLLQEISNYIDLQKENIVNDWIELIKIPSVKTEKDEKFPFGKNVDDLLCLATELFNKNGFEMKKNTESGYALYRGNRDSDKTIGVFAHGDVVPVNEDEWTITKPFEPIIKNDYVIGRGCRDNKNGIIAALYALKALKACGKKLNNSVLVYVGGNEEAGMEDIEAFVRDEKIPDISLVPDNSFPYAKGEWGIVKLMAKSKRRFESILDFSGGEAYNIVLDCLQVAMVCNNELLQNLKDSKTDFYIENGIVHFSEKGIAGHVAHPDGTLNAASVAAKKLLNIASINENDRKILESLDIFLDSSTGEGLDIDRTDEYGSLTVGNGIVKLTDGYLNFSLDIRFSPITDKDDVISKVKSTMDKNGFEIEVTGASNGFVLKENPDLTNAFLKSMAMFGADTSGSPYIEKGLTYARHLKDAYSFGASLNWDPELIGIAPGTGKAHSVHEAASIDGLIQCIKILASMILDTDKFITDNNGKQHLEVF